VKKLLIAMAIALGPVAGMLGAGEASAVSTAELWTSRYNGPGNSWDRAVSIAASPDGTTVFVVGPSVGGGGRHPDYATVAYEASTGAQLWTRRYNAGNGDDFPTAVAVSPDGATVFVTGGSMGVSSDLDYATIAYGASTGVRLWTRRFDGPEQDIATALTVSSDGSKLFVTGDSFSTARADDYQTLAYDAVSGARLWGRRYDGPVGDCRNDHAHSIAASPDGTRVFVTGQSCGVAGGGSGDATLAYDAATGDRLWLKRFEFDGYFPGVGSSVGVSPDGQTVFVTGSGVVTTALQATRTRRTPSLSPPMGARWS
jgi:WD40 repeat protein